MEKTSLDAILTEWLENHIKGIVKESTVHIYRFRVYKYIYPFILNKQIEKINKEEIEIFIKGLLNQKTKRSLASQTINGIFIVLSQLFDYFVERGLVLQNPCVGISLSKHKQTKVKVFTRNEQKQLIDYLLKEANAKSLTVLISLFTGMRIGEICALNWSDVDLNNQIIRISSTTQRISADATSRNRTKIIFQSPKTHSSIREIPLSKFVADLLRSIYTQEKKDDDCVFCKKNGSRYDIRTIQKYFGEVLSNLNISNKSFHTLRHTFATSAIEAHVDVKALSMLLGHANITTTMNIYVHPGEEHLRSMITSIGKFLVKED